MRPIRKHIIHCSDSLTGDVPTIRRWHLARGFTDIGYHFVIRLDGEVELGRPLTDPGAHCQGHNADSIGTCLIGRVQFNPQQLQKLEELHRWLKELFPGLKAYGHRDFTNQKTCPNFNVKEVLHD